MPVIGAQSLAGGKLGLAYERHPVLVPASAQPGKRSLLPAAGGRRLAAARRVDRLRPGARDFCRRRAFGPAQDLDALRGNAVAVAAFFAREPSAAEGPGYG